MKSTLMAPVLAMLMLTLGACQPTPPPDEPSTTAEPSAEPTAPEPTPPAIDDQPLEDVPPATATALLPPPGAGQAQFDGYGDLRFGMSETELRQAWSGELSGPPASGDCHYLSPASQAVPADLAFMVEGDRFVRYDIGTRTPEAPGGGRAGMSADEVRALYAGHVEERPHKYVEGGANLRVTDAAGSDGVLVFEVDADGEVTRWRAGLPPQVDYVEGCS
jgi:hypothetical protein